MEKWTIEKSGVTFYCTYERKTDWVEVCCEHFDGAHKGASGKLSGPKVIAQLLAGEIIREKRVT